MLMIQWQMFLENCGYLATFMGTLLEGEISLLTSVIGARMGYYNYYGALVAAFFGAYIADFFKYYIGKKHGQKLLEKKPSIQKKLDRSTAWFEKHPYLTLSVYKFFFGFTTIIMVMAGLKDISYVRFALHSAIGVALWVLVLGGFGYGCAEHIIMKIEWVGTHKFEVILVLSSIAFLYWFFIKRPRDR